MHAKEPDQLLFWQLPEACGMEPFDTAAADGARAKQFFDALRASITELQRAYEDLLRDLQELLFRAFDLSERSKVGGSGTGDSVLIVWRPRLKAVVNHIANSHMDETLWIEAIATTIVGKAPKSWTDDDRVRFEIGLAEMSRNIRHLEALLYEERKRLDAGKRLEEVFRIGVADRKFNGSGRCRCCGATRRIAIHGRGSEAPVAAFSVGSPASNSSCSIGLDLANDFLENTPDPTK